MKQKHWQVSVFDKTSETIKNDTFYTTDTEAYLTFELIDEDFTPDSATVTVYNIYGKATINANVEVADGIVQYEMPEDAIGHPGGWRTQVIYTKDNEDYTTGIIEFDVGGHLLDNKKPAIVDIENWNSFIEHAGELIDDWEQLEEIRQANEQQRELAESARQTTFETNESTRQSEFETNETSRQTNELVREEAENNRQSTFETNEAERESTFETNESTRQANELIREEAEGNRQSIFEEKEVGRQSEFEENEQARESAESVRVANEEERELNEAERISKDSERDSKIEEIERVATEPPKPIHTLKVENEVFSSDEVSVSEGVITINHHNLKVGDKVAFVATATSYSVVEPFDGAMRLNTVYYVVNLSNDSFQISTTQSGEPIVFNIDTKGFLWQFEKVSVNRLQVRGLDGTKYRVVFTGGHDGNRLPSRLLNAYTNPGDVPARYGSEDNQNTITATDIKPVHGVIDVYSEMLFKVINRKILITVDSSFTTIGETSYNHIEETYRNRIITRTTNPTVGFQDSINVIGVGGRHLFDGSTMEVYEA